MPAAISTISDRAVQLLRDSIMEEYGKAIVTKSDCDQLSEQIDQQTNKHISVNTLRRFFDVMPSSHKPSLETLNILSRYCGFVDLLDFQKSIDQNHRAKSDLTPSRINDLYQSLGDTHQFYQTLDWLVQLAFSDKNILFLKSFFDLEVFRDKLDYTQGEHKRVLMTLGLEMQANPKQFDILIGHYAAIPLAQALYFECFVDYDFLGIRHYRAIQAYAQNRKDDEAQLFSLCILFLHSFLLRDRVTCSETIRKINAIKLSDDLHPFPAGRKMACNILFQAFYQGKINEGLIKEIFAHEKQIPRVGPLGRSIPVYHSLVAEAFTWSGYHDEAIAIVELAMRCYATESTYHTQNLLSNLWIAYAGSLLKSNRIGESKAIFDKVNTDHFAPHTKNFDLMHYYNVNSELQKRDNPKLAASLKTSALKTAARYQFKFFETLYS